MNILKTFPNVYVYYIHFIILNIFLYSIYGDVFEIERIYKQSLLINPSSSVHIASSHGKRIFVYMELKNDLNNANKQKQLSQILPESTNKKIVDNLGISNMKNMMNDKIKDDDSIIFEHQQLSIEGNFDSSTTIEPLITSHEQIQSNKVNNVDITNSVVNDDVITKKSSTLEKETFDKVRVSTKSPINKIDNEKVIPTKDYFFSPHITTEKTITSISKPNLQESITEKENLLPTKNLLLENIEKKNLLAQPIQFMSKNKGTQSPTWSFGKISVKLEKSLKNKFNDDDNILTEDTFLNKKNNNEIYQKDDVNGNKKIDKNLHYYTSINKKNNNYFKFLNVKIENMHNDDKHEKEDFPKVIKITKGQKEVKYNEEDIVDEEVDKVKYLKDFKNSDEDDSQTDEIKISVNEDDDDVLTQLFNEKKEKNVLDSIETVTIGEHVTVEEIEYDETDEQNITPYEDEFDEDFLEEGERFDFNETMLTEFVNDTLKRDEKTLRITLVDKMLLEKDVTENTGDYSGSHIYPTLISQNYNNNSLPIMFSDIPVYVMVSLDILDISSFNMQSMDFVVDVLINMRWYDMRLVHGMNKPITISEEKILQKIWKPDPYIVNAKRSYLHKITFPNIKMRIFSDGLVLYTIHITIQPSCNMKFCMFPHDHQECYLDLSSLSYSDGQLKFIWHEDPYFLVNSPILPEFKLTNITVNECLSHDKLITSSCLRLRFKLQRDSAKYIVEKYIPSTLAMMFAWVAPYVPYNYEDVRIVTPITILLALVQMQKGEIETRTSYLTSLDKWFAVMKVFSVISLMESLVVLSLVRKFRELKKKEAKAINEFEKEMIKLQQRQVKKLYNRIDLYARIISPVVFSLYLIYYLIFMVTGNEEYC